MKRIWLALVLSAAVLCSGCSLVPREEQLPESPILYQESREKEIQVEVCRGNLVREVKISCVYKPAEMEKLSFAEGGEPVSEVYVKRGDRVKAGDLLAELDNRQLNRQIFQQQQVLDELQMRADQMQQKQELWWSRCAELTEAAAVNPEKYAARSDQANRQSYEISKQLKQINKQLRVEQMTMDELQQRRDGRLLYASADGTVYSVTDTDSGKVIQEGQTICTVADLSKGVFKAKQKENLLHIGDRVVIDCGTEEYEAEVIAISDGNNPDVSMRPVKEGTAIDTDTGGQIEIVAEEKKDVLYLPAKAVVLLPDGPAVYYRNEKGVKCVKTVKTGMTTKGLTEICSGLEEGEMVLR